MTGSVGSQSLGLSSYFITTLDDTLAPGQSISVHITSPTDAADATSGTAAPGFDSTGTAAAGIVTLGTANNYGVLGLQNTKIANTSVTIHGNEGVSQGGALANNAPSTITGNANEYASGQYSGPGTVGGSVVVNPTLLAQNDADALTASSEASALTPTQTFTAINTSGSTTTTITGNGGLNVVKIGSISMSGSSSLILKGTASDVSSSSMSRGPSAISGTGVMGLTEGVTANHVLYNLTGASNITTNAGNALFGTFLAPNANWNVDGSFVGEIIDGGSTFSLNGGANVNAGANDIGGTSTNPALNVGGLANYAVLYAGTGNNQLSISNDTINGNIGVGGGQVQFNGPGTIHGRLDFSAANSNQYHNTNGSNVGPTSVNYNVSAVTTAIAAANSLSSSLGGLTGTNISFNNSNQTINESSGTLYTNVNGVNYRVFNVTSYSENNNDTVTIVGDGSGDPVVFNFAYNSNTNLGGQVMLTGGLTDDQVMWNFTSSNRQVQLNDNGGTYLGVILAPHDQYQSASSNLYGRVYGGAAGNMQIVSGANVFTPAGSLINTATVSATNESSIPSATATITITPAVHNVDLSATSGSLAYTPSQIRSAYGINNLSLDGTGQTIAIVDAYDNPAIFQTLDTFDNQFGLTDSGPTLAQQYGNASSFLTVLNQDGQASSLPAVDPTGGWEAEEALDVEWVHAVAPGAQIVLVEASNT